MQVLLRFLYIYSTYVYVQTYRLWKRGGLVKDGMTMVATAVAGTAVKSMEEASGCE